MKTLSIIALVVLFTMLIKGRANDTIIDRVDHLPKIDKIHVPSNDIDSIVNVLHTEIANVKALQEEDKKYYQMELESDQAVIEAQRELVLTLLKRNESKGISE